MKPRLPISVTTCSLLLVFTPLSHAQIRDRDAFNWTSCGYVHGTVYQAPGSASIVYSVELQSFGGAAQQQSSPITNSAFVFDCVPAGYHDLRVVDYRGRVLRSMQIDVRTGSNSVQVMLSSVQGERPASPWVSMRKLKRKTDGKAERELRGALGAIERGRFDEAIQHSNNALARDPAHPEALVALGVAQARLGQYEEASLQFTKAAELDPDHVPAHSNLAIAMLRLQRYSAAEEAARRSLKIVRPLPLMDYVLGVSLGAQNRNLDEALEHLDRAAAVYPRAGVVAARLLVEAGRSSDAATRLEKYLRVSGDIQGRKDLESLLAQLK